MAQNPKWSKKTTTSLVLKGNYIGEGLVETEDCETFDILALLQSFKNQDVRISVKAEYDED